jgi:hypothetical protein
MVQQPSTLYKRHCFSGVIISHAARLYYQFLLSYRDVEWHCQVHQGDTELGRIG